MGEELYRDGAEGSPGVGSVCGLLGERSRLDSAETQREEECLPGVSLRREARIDVTRSPFL